jgi:hypothetical protein
MATWVSMRASPMDGDTAAHAMDADARDIDGAHSGAHCSARVQQELLRDQALKKNCHTFHEHIKLKRAGSKCLQMQKESSNYLFLYNGVDVLLRKFIDLF